MIDRFESEYPETRVPPPPELLPPDVHDILYLSTPIQSPSPASYADTSLSHAVSSTNGKESESDEEDESYNQMRLRRSSRQASDVSLAAKALGREEGTVHKLGQQVKRKILGHEHQDADSETRDSSMPGSPPLPAEGADSNIQERIEDEHIRVLKEKLVMLKRASADSEDPQDDKDVVMLKKVMSNDAGSTLTGSTSNADSTMSDSLHKS
jgi:hypothetical protein